jgi:hypothetical protein
MASLSRGKTWLLWLGIGLLPALAYMTWLRAETVAYFAGTGSDWFAQLAEALYPRLRVERLRFDPSFFVQKTDQLLFRWVLMLALVGGFGPWLGASPRLQARLLAWWQVDIAPRSLTRLRWAFYLATLWFTWPWWAELRTAQGYAAFYRPVPLLAGLGQTFPPPWLIDVGFGAYLAALGLVLGRVRPAFSATLVAIGFFLAQAYLQSFEKTDHGFATWGYAVALFPVMLATAPAAWPLRLVQVALVGAYLLAALEKLLVSGGTWLSAAGFQAQLHLHPTPWGQQVAAIEWLCWVLPAGAWLFQASFWLSLLRPNWRWVLLPAGVLFHTGTYLLLGAGGYLSPWWVIYLFFLPNLVSRPKGVGMVNS